MGQRERFDAFMERCLYGPDGFYTTGAGSAGRRSGDFITSPEVGPLFGEVVARWLDQQWLDLGSPESFTVIDAGTGPGTLLRALEHAGPACAAAWNLIGVDRGPSAEISEGVERRGSLPADLNGAVVIANELLDNLAFRIVGREPDGWVEHHVQFDDQSTGAIVFEPVADPGLDVAIGRSVPLLDQAHAWVREVLGRGASRLLVFDYGVVGTRELAERGGWLRTYRGHQRGNNPLVEPGAWDITTDIAVDQLPEPDHVSTQESFLRRWGIDRLVEQGEEQWRANAAAPTLEDLRMRSRGPESTALLDPAGLGGWLALEWRQDADAVRAE